MSTALPLHTMIRQVISTATEKLAADEQRPEKVKNLIDYEKAEHGHVPTPAEEEAEKKAQVSFTSAEWVEKLASATDYIAENINEVEVSQAGPVAAALDKLAKEESGSPQGAGKGKGVLTVTKAIGGTQSYKKDHPSTEDAAASQAGKPLSAGGNPGGKTQLDNNMHSAPGQGSGVKPTATYPAKGPLVNNGKAKTAAEEIKEKILLKLAGEDVMPASISASKGSNPLAGKGQLKSFDAGEAPPKASGGPTSGFGNQGRKLIASNTAAIDATKKDAKGPVKSQLKEVLEEPALSPKTDTVLQRNLRNTGKAGVKIAAVRDLLKKVAAAGCTCGGKNECEFDLLKEAAARAKGREKVAMGGMGGGAMAAPAAAPMGGGGMGAMAEVGAGADGCTCGNAGACIVCKLKAELAAAKAGAMPQGAAAPVSPAMGVPQAMGAGVEKDSMGANCY